MYNPHKVQLAAHEAFLTEDKKRGAIFWGRRVGKTLWSIWHGTMAACVKQGPYWYIFDTRQHAKDVLWEGMLATIPRNLIAKIDASELVITFKHLNSAMKLPGLGWQEIQHDESKLPSSIRLSGSDFADRDRGGEAEGIIFDEYQNQEPDKWEGIYEPFLATTNGWACFMGTSNAYDHWYELREHAKEDPDWFNSEATWRVPSDHIVDGKPMISREWIAQSKDQARKRGKLDIWLREYELAIMTPQKAVYPMFNRKIHIKDPDEVPAEGTYYGVWDFGYAEGHPTAFGLVLIDTQGRWWLYDELYGTYIDMDHQIEQIRMKIAGKHIEGIIADSARPDLMDYARSKGLNIIPAPKRQGSVVSGIELLRQRLVPRDQLLGPEPNLFFTKNCRNAIEEFEKYAYREVKEDRPAREEPVKMNDNLPDAVRYLALYLKYGLQKKTPPPKNTFKGRLDRYGMLRT